jgi:hypothetical protein
VLILQKKCIIFHTKGEKVDLGGKTIVFNKNELDKQVDPSLITPLERICNGNPSKQGR